MPLHTLQAFLWLGNSMYMRQCRYNCVPAIDHMFFINVDCMINIWCIHMLVSWTFYKVRNHKTYAWLLFDSLQIDIVIEHLYPLYMYHPTRNKT